jgi:RHS repeat-associated protein
LAGRCDWEFKGPLAHSFAPTTRTNSYDADNRLLTFNKVPVTNDADGNLTYGPLTNGTFGAYAYDPRNELVSVGGLGYGYDPAGNRTSITNGSAVSTLTMDSQTARTLIRVKNGITYYYIYGLGLIYEIDETSTTTNLVFYHFDRRGSTVALTDINGKLTDQIEYSPYGITTYRVGTNDTPFCFNGQFGVQTDPNGLLYMRARYYNPYLCRFLNPDPSGFSGGLNLYAFASGNPVDETDPFGLGAVDYLVPQSSWFSSGGYNDVGSGFDVTWDPIYSINTAVDFGSINPLVRDLANSSFSGQPTPMDTIGAPDPLAGTTDGLTLGGPAPGSPMAGVSGQLNILIYTSVLAFTPGGAAAEGGFGGGTTFTHFTDAAGLEGITGVSASSLSSGQSLTVGQLSFGMGSNPFLASAPGDIFVTDLSATASAGELNGIGVFGARQSFAIQFSQESALLNGATPILQRPGIFTIPGGTIMQGTFRIIVR